METIYFDKTKTLAIDPRDFFDRVKARIIFDDINEFLYEQTKVVLKTGTDAISRELYLYPFINDQRGYFKGSRFAPDGWIRGKDFAELIYKLCAMILGEQALNMTSHDWKTWYIINYGFDRKELFPFLRMTNTVAFRNDIPACRMCGVLRPDTKIKTKKPTKL